MKECKWFSTYKGIRKPKCNDGAGCDACRKKYYINRAKKLGKMSASDGFKFIGSMK